MLVYKQYTERINALHAVIIRLRRNGRPTEIEEGKLEKLRIERQRYAKRARL